MQQTITPSDDRSALDGLWVLLVENEGQLNSADQDGQVPMMARTGNDETYLLGFKNMSNARKFMQQSAADTAQPRMVVKGNKNQLLRIARDAGVVGVLVDYDPVTQRYAAATELY